MGRAPDFCPKARPSATNTAAAWFASGSIRTRQIPRRSAALRTPQRGLHAFDRRIIDATYDMAAAYKPQIAFYSALGAEKQLAASIRYIRERAPARAGDSRCQARRHRQHRRGLCARSFDRYGADAVTVNPYMGEDSVRPFLARKDRGAVAALPHQQSRRQGFSGTCKSMACPCTAHVAQRADRDWNEYGNVMLVVGATCPKEMARAARGASRGDVPGARHRRARRRS